MDRRNALGCDALRTREENTMKSMARGLITAVSTMAIASTPVLATAAVPTVVEQGRAVYIDGYGLCTIGFNDPEKAVSYIAAHCGGEGARVSLIDRTTNEVSDEMGTFHPSTKYTRFPYNDWAWIEWDEGVQMGSNSFSGDRVLEQDEVHVGDEVCSHGETTHTGTRGVSCGTFGGWSGESFGVQETSWQQGDSGGPVWVPGRGLVGVMSGAPVGDLQAPTMMIGGKWVTGKHVSWGTAIRDGETMSESQYAKDFARLSGLNVDNFVVLPNNNQPPVVVPDVPAKPEAPKQTEQQPTPVDPAGKTPQPSGSSLSTGGIVALVLGLLVAAAIPVVLQFL